MSATVAAKHLFRSFQEVRKKRSLYAQVREYRRFVGVHYETDEFIVTTAEAGPELLKVLQLRHEVFVEEWQGRQAKHGLDVDEYDFNADHLMIFDKVKGEVIGTYRLLSSHFTHNFYSASEFDIQRFLRVPAVKLEMGRACVQAAYRDGRVIDVLWKGLAQYIQRTNTEYLFGCSSVKTVDAALSSRLYQSLRDQGSWSDDYAIRPTPDYLMPGFSLLNQKPLDASERRNIVPPLLRSYIHAGAKVYGLPALDRDFACIDLCTILDWKDLNRRFKSRFVGEA